MARLARGRCWSRTNGPFTVFWVAGDSPGASASLVLGTTLATGLSGVTAYGTGVNVGLGAERLQLAARGAGISPAPQGKPALDRMTGKSPE